MLLSVLMEKGQIQIFKKDGRNNQLIQGENKSGSPGGLVQWWAIVQNPLYQSQGVKMLSEETINRFLSGSLQPLNLPFHLIIKANDHFHLFTEYSGYFQLTWFQTSQNEIVLSTSFMECVNRAERLCLGHQECMEYIHSSAIYNNKTLFREIEILPAGHHIDLVGGKRRLVAQYHLEPTSVEKLYQTLEENFRKIPDAGLPVFCDLSGGYDTRTATACLIPTGEIRGFVANNRSLSVSQDIQIAQTIADSLLLPLHRIAIEPVSVDYTNLSALEDIDFIRGWDIAWRLITEIQNKALCQGLIVGGWGAEMLRNQHGRNSNLVEIARGFGFKRMVHPNPSIDNAYVSTLTQKILTELALFGIDPDEPRLGEKVYYFVKARHWAGSMLTLRNNYLPTLFPFYEPSIAFSILGLANFPSSLQTDVIRRFSPDLLKFPFHSGDSPVASHGTGPFARLLDKALVKIKKSFGAGTSLPATDYPFPLDQFETNQEFNQFIGFDLHYLISRGNTRLVPRYLSIQALFQKNREKISLGNP